MRVRFLLGPAGSGKTFRCLTEIRHALTASQEGPPLLLLAPKQTTYQLERQFLAYPSIPGYTRLHILSFERLAHFIFERLGKRSPDMLDEEGRLMVLRGLLAKKRDDLKLFRASARLTGFAHQLSLVLRELQRNQLTPESLNQLAEQVRNVDGLAFKLQDLATLLRDYLDWLKAHNLQDADCLLAAATEALSESPASHSKLRNSDLELRTSDFGLHLWVDGFAEWSPQELDLLAALLPQCQEATLTFCLERVPAEKGSWLSNWSVMRRAFEECKKRFARLPNADLSVQVLPRHPNKSRFLNNPVLLHLEKFWAAPQPYPAPKASPAPGPQNLEFEFGPPFGPRPSDLGLEPSALRVAICANPEAEVTLAAREILRHVRAGGRYCDVTVLVRSLAGYHEPLQRLFSRYGIPFFMDRRESVSHHPLAELTRSALRTVAMQWMGDDWFAALKTGLVPAEDVEIDRLENEALARGWRGSLWQKPLTIAHEPELTEWLADLHRRILPPFQKLAVALGARQNKPTGPQLAEALRQFWQALHIEERLKGWAAAEISSADFRIPNSVHATVWEQMNAWLENVVLAFPNEPLPLREWLPILEAGLANLTVGVIPPALDQVLIGAIDRSRNPDIKLALVLGLNETVFPAPPEANVLLTEMERTELEKRNVMVGATARQQLGRERYHAYIACTRARQRVVLTSALQDANGAPLNPSPFLSQIRQLFPDLQFETVPRTLDWQKSEHPVELLGPLLKACNSHNPPPVEQDGGSPHSADHVSPSSGPSTCDSGAKRRPDTSGNPQLSTSSSSGPSTINPQLSTTPWAALTSLPALAGVLERLRHFQNTAMGEALSPELAPRLYGPILRTSVSRMEQFAACPFKFFVHSGLRAEERKRFELDKKEQGTFQHDVLAYFHEQLRREKKRWRDVTPLEARERVGRIAQGLIASYRDGLLQASEESRFMARILTESLQDFVETLVGWMRQQYQFDPVEVELPFGEGDSSPAWVIPLGNGNRLELYGRIDRVDLCGDSENGETLCVVVDYKSSQKQLDPVLMAHGLQLQLLTYLNVLRRWPSPRALFGAARLVPAGVFYVSLRGKYEREQNRLDALAAAEEARKLAYRHTGRFDASALPLLDARDVQQGDQFNYRLTRAGEVHKGCREAMAPADFAALLDSVEANVMQMGRQIFSGHTQVSPYRKGSSTACDQCDYRPICRMDPWTHGYRVLRKEEEEAAV